MSRLGFADRWIRLIMMCVKSTTYAVLVNGTPTGRIFPTRGIRQGDPISPYLFLLCAEALSSLLTKAESTNVLPGVPTSKKGPRLSHLFFADDSLLFCKASALHWNRLSEILSNYESASGQRLNQAKTSIFFSRNTPEIAKQEILRLSGIPSTQRYDKYLGLPAIVGKSRRQAFKSIKDRVWRRLNDWKLKLLSQAGKEVLLKAVIQAIPTYSMSIFLLPKGLCSEINSMMQKFWWGNQENGSHIHWMKWSRMGLSKNQGGMGFRDLVCFNKALLAKQGWRLIKSPESLAGKIIRAKYYPNSSFLEASLGSKPSFAWRSIHGARELLSEGLMWRVGNGRRINIWGDNWVPIPSTYRIHSPPKSLTRESKVRELFDNKKTGWDRDKLVHNFSVEEIAAILSIPISQTEQPDAQIWRCTNTGIFSVKSAYHLAKEMETRDTPEGSCGKKDSNLWKTLWKLPIPNAAKNFFWRACQNILPTKDNLLRKKVVKEPYCPICEKEPETVLHALWACPAAADIWGNCKRIFQKCHTEGESLMKIVEEILHKGGLDDFAFFVQLARQVWHRRNTWVHEGVFVNPNVIIRRTMEQTEAYNKAHERILGENEIIPECEIKWMAPTQGWYKANWDVAIDKSQGRVGIGVIIRDEKGQTIAAMSKTRLENLEPTTGEAFAAFNAACLCRDLELQHIMMEGDAKLIVDAVNSNTTTWSRFGHIIDDTRRILDGFIRWKCNHVRREANEAAHRLAKAATMDVSDRIWRDTTPNCISDIVLMERLALSCNC
jgi:ribonuclease HI